MVCCIEAIRNERHNKFTMNKKNLEKAANKAVTESRRNMTWPVYEPYFIWYEDKQGPDGAPERTPHLGAPEPNFPRKPSYDPKTGKQAKDYDGGRMWELKWWENDKSVERIYAPLQHPEILFKLAELGDLLNIPEKWKKKQTTPLAEMRAFAGKYGLLGVSDPTGRDESLLEFTVAASRVARTLRLFEAASANDGSEQVMETVALVEAYRPAALVAEPILCVEGSGTQRLGDGLGDLIKSSFPEIGASGPLDLATISFYVIRLNVR